MLDFLKSRSVKFYIEAAAVLIAFVGLIVYFAYGGALGAFNGAVLALWIIALVAGVAALVTDWDFLALGMTILLSFAIFVFLTCTESIGSFTDYVNGIVAFGHSEFVGNILAVFILGLIADIVAITACFFKGKNRKAQ